MSQHKRTTLRAGYSISAARLAAIQALYELSISRADPLSVIKNFANKHWRSITLRDPDSKPGLGGKARLPNPNLKHLTEIVLDVTNYDAKYENEIEQILEKEWTLDRLDNLMLALLKSATYEFIEKKEIPVGIVIGEYIDLAHAFFNDKEANFASGIINQLASHHRPG